MGEDKKKRTEPKRKVWDEKLKTSGEEKDEKIGSIEEDNYENGRNYTTGDGGDCVGKCISMHSAA